MAVELSKLKDNLFDALQSCVKEYRRVESVLDKLSSLSYQLERLQDALKKLKVQKRYGCGVHYAGCWWASDTASCCPDTCPGTDSAFTYERVNDAMRALVSMLRPDATADSTNEVDNACARLRRSFAEIRACRGEKSTRRRGEGRAGI